MFSRFKRLSDFSKTGSFQESRVLWVPSDKGLSPPPPLPPETYAKGWTTADSSSLMTFFCWLQPSPQLIPHHHRPPPILSRFRVVFRSISSRDFESFLIME